jgi:exportin-1
MPRVSIDAFIDKLFASYQDITEFRLILRDFLIELREFSGSDTGDLFSEERESEQAAREKMELERMARVGGLIKPGEIDDDVL